MNTKELGYIGLGVALSTSELDKEALVDDSIKSVQSFLDKLYKIKVDNYGN